jgi:hypothetical protein
MMTIILVPRTWTLVEKLNEELAFLAYFGIRAGCGINKLRRMSGPLGNKSTPRNQRNHKVTGNWALVTTVQ